jgi:hypothetical protein
MVGADLDTSRSEVISQCLCVTADDRSSSPVMATNVARRWASATEAVGRQ